MTTHSRQYLQGTLEVLVLKAVSWGPMHGYGIQAWLTDRTEGALDIEQGSLYPALHRMEVRRWISAEWRITEKNRRGKFYRLTTLGRKQLRQDARAWSQFAGAVAGVLDGTEAPKWATGRGH